MEEGGVFVGINYRIVYFGDVDRYICMVFLRVDDDRNLT